MDDSKRNNLVNEQSYRERVETQKMKYYELQVSCEKLNLDNIIFEQVKWGSESESFRNEENQSFGKMMVSRKVLQD
jgi:hypothetical protein